MHIVIKNCLLACRVDSEEDLYRLWVEGYQGNATDSLGSHNGYAFSTFDRDNDEAPVSNTRLKFQLPCSPSPLSSLKDLIHLLFNGSILLLLLFSSLAAPVPQLMAVVGGSTGKLSLLFF